MPARLAALVTGAYPPGVYRWRSRAHPGAIGRELAGAGWVGYDLPGVADSAQLLDECAGILTFPGWFGHTWEGLGDCLADLSWLPGEGHVVLWERYGALAGGDGKAWRQAYETLERAVATRIRYAAPPLFVLLRGTGPDVSPVDGTPIRVLPLAPGRTGTRGGGNPGNGGAAVSATAGSRPRRAR